MASDWTRPVDDPRPTPVALPKSLNGEWIETIVHPPAGGALLEKADLLVDPPTAFRVYRVYRQSDGALLANGGWDRSRTRPIRIIPASSYVGGGDAVRFTACGWFHDSLEGTVTWAPA